MTIASHRRTRKKARSAGGNSHRASSTGRQIKVEHVKHPDKRDQRLLALWAADCAEHVLPFFEEKHPGDDRPRKAIEAGRTWARGGITYGAARAAAVATHAAARAVDEGAARAAARAAGHAAGTAHMASHARHAAAYAIKAVVAAGTDSATECDWQRRRLPEQLRPTAFPLNPPTGLPKTPSTPKPSCRRSRALPRSARRWPNGCAGPNRTS